MRPLLFLILFLLSLHSHASSPFSIPFKSTDPLTKEDYIKVQNQLREIDIRPLLETLHPQNSNYALFEDFLGRCSRGIRQMLINVDKKLLPVHRLIKIGKGSEMCIVSCVPYQAHYPELVKTIPEALEASGFNGYFLYQIGGFPNPTGIEIQYAGVPYSFKIFMMLEAGKLGFDKVLWIDSAAIPLNNPTPLFDWIEKNGALICQMKANPSLKKYILPSTREELKQLTGTDVIEAPYVCTILFGLNIRSKESAKLIESYYEYVALGTPFLSCFPEEFVLTAILNQSDYKGWKPHPFTKLLKGAEKNTASLDGDEEAKKTGYFFYHRNLR